MTCPEGHANPDGAAFCNTCGRPLTGTVAPADPPAPTGTTSARTSRRPLLLGAAAVAVVAVVAVVVAVVVSRGDGTTASEENDDATFTVSGTLALTDDDMQNPSFDRILNHCNFDSTCSQPADEPCAAGSPGYSDIGAGAQVRVTDSSGTVVGVGALEEGVTPHTPDIWAVDGYYPPCLFSFTIEDVPDSGRIYGLEVSQRGTLQFTRAEAESLSFSLGD